ncbi:putative reverse transcriptase domain-containing protein [Tanacetum coccineum]
MPPTMMTRSARRPAAASRGRGTGSQAGRGGGRTRGHSGDQDDGKIDGQAGQVGGQGSEVNDGVNKVPDFSTINAQQLQNLLPTIFLACNPKEYDGKGGAIVYTCWIEKIESVQDISGCRDSQKVKYTTGLFVGKALTWWNSQIHTRGQEAAVGLATLRILIGFMSWLGMVAATEPKTIQKAMQIAGTLTDEALRNGSIKKNPEKRGNGGEPSKDRNGREDNKRTRIENAFATTTNPVRRENTSAVPKCTTCNTHHPLEVPCRACFNYNLPGHFAKDCRVVPRNVNPINARNLIRYGNQGNQSRGRAFMLGVEEARQDPNIMTGTFTLNDHFSTTLFDSSADYSFVFTTFIPLLDIEPSELGFSYEIEIASEQLVEIDKVIKGCKLEIEGHVFDINLIPFGSGSFNVIIGMDWLSDHKAEIICHEKVERIPLLDNKVLRVLGEKPKENVRQLMSTRTKEQKQEKIIVVKDFPEVFLDDLSGLPPIQEIEFWIELVPGAMPVAKSPYHLAPSVLEELSG